jgi:uncharacterized protein YndB with AHSA1/START domain
MTDNTEPLVIERTINAPSDKVWQALTDIEQLQKWLPFFKEFKPEVGFETRFELGPADGKKYEHICRVVDVVDGQSLTYTWYFEGHPGKSHVIFDISEAGGQTSLRLTHAILEPFSEEISRDDFAEGWNSTADGLKEFVESNK